jgi:hypothetical protein
MTFEGSDANHYALSRNLCDPCRLQDLNVLRRPALIMKGGAAALREPVSNAPSLVKG